MTTLNTRFAEALRPKEGKITCTAGATKYWTVRFSKVISSVSTKLMQDNTDKTSSYMTGSTSVDSSGYVVTTQTTDTDLPPGDYVLEIWGTVEGRMDCYMAVDLVVRKGGDNT